MPKDDVELIILRTLENSPDLTQRQLADKLGLSLGKTNYLIRALIGKGLLKIQNFRKSNNKIAYLYFLTPKGIAEKTVLTNYFLQRKSEEYNNLKKEIENLKKELNIH